MQLQGIRVSIPMQSFYNKYEDTEHSRFLRLCRMRVIIKTFLRSICFFFQNSLMRKRPLFKITKSIFVGLKSLWELLNCHFCWQVLTLLFPMIICIMDPEEPCVILSHLTAMRRTAEVLIVWIRRLASFWPVANEQKDE